MTKTQLLVLWAGIGILVLFSLFPPNASGAHYFIFDDSSVSVGRLIVECGIVVLITGGLIYTLRVDPDLMLKIPCVLLYLNPFRKARSYQEILKDAKKDTTNIFGFWLVVLLCFVFLRFLLSTAR